MPNWQMVVKLEFINEQGDKVGRQMRVITTGVELRKTKFIFEKKTSTQTGGIYSSCHVMERSLPTDFDCSSSLSPRIGGTLPEHGLRNF